jgi:SAM-dependent methyltransferase
MIRNSFPGHEAYERHVARYVKSAYNNLLLRDPDPEGLRHFVGKLSSGEITRAQFLETLRGSEEFRFHVRFTDLLNSLHLSRCDFVQGLPRARRILDLGGAHQSSDQGAFVGLGYPYEFDELVIVDLPPAERHELYREGGVAGRVQTPLGPVVYRNHSMADFSGFADAEFDLVYCGQAIEHVPEDVADEVCAGAFRVLQPGGHFALDTPNGRVCRLQQAGMINPDHDVEYTHAELAAKLEKAGFEVVEARGLNYCGRAAAQGTFSMKEAAANQGLYWEIDDCYLLAYVCRKPGA